MKNIEKAGKAYLKTVKGLLRSKRFRDEEKNFIAEGEKIVFDILAGKGKVCSVLCSDSFIGRNPEKIRSMLLKETFIFSVKDTFFDRVSLLRNSRGILAVCEKPRQDISILDKLTDKLVVLFDNIQDPGNVGTLIRSAAAFDAAAVLLYGETADVYNPRVVRASSGTILSIPVIEVSPDDISGIKKYGFNLISADNSNGESISIFDINLPVSGTIVAFGNEGSGISSRVLENTDRFFNIPMQNEVESLNVAMAGSIAMFYFMIFKNGRR